LWGSRGYSRPLRHHKIVGAIAGAGCRMFLRFAIPLSLVLCVYGGDVPHVVSNPTASQVKTDAFGSEDHIPLYPSIISGDSQDEGKAAQVAKKNDSLTEMSKLSLIRYVSGEFAKAKKPLPGGKDGIVLYADKPLDEQNLDRQVTMHGAAVNTGDNCQITRLEFREHLIVVDVNGGEGPRKTGWNLFNSEWEECPRLQPRPLRRMAPSKGPLDFKRVAVEPSICNSRRMFRISQQMN